MPKPLLSKNNSIEIVKSNISILKEIDKSISINFKTQKDEMFIKCDMDQISITFFNLIKDDSTYLEREPLEKAAENGDMFAYKHEGFWHCMDTKRDRDSLIELNNQKVAPWLKKN